MTQLASWRWVLLINVPIALVTAVAATRFVRESHAHVRAGYDVPGAVAVTGGLFLLVYGFTVAGTHGWSASLTIGLLAGAAALLAAFVAVELRSPHPLLPVRVILDRNRGGAFLASLLVGSALLGTFLFLTYFLQETLRYSALKTGFAFLPFSGGIIMGAGVASRLLPRVGPRTLMVVGLVLASGGLFWFSDLGVTSTYLAHVLPPEVLVSLGMGMAFVPMSSTALIGVDPTDAGVASAFVNATQQVGGSLGTALLNTVAASAATSYLADHLHATKVLQKAAVHGYTTAFTVSALLLAAAALVAGLLIRASREKIQPEAQLAPRARVRGRAGRRGRARLNRVPGRRRSRRRPWELPARLAGRNRATVSGTQRSPEFASETQRYHRCESREAREAMDKIDRSGIKTASRLLAKAESTDSQHEAVALVLRAYSLLAEFINAYDTAQAGSSPDARRHERRRLWDRRSRRPAAEPTGTVPPAATPTGAGDGAAVDGYTRIGKGRAEAGHSVDFNI